VPPRNVPTCLLSNPADPARCAFPTAVAAQRDDRLYRAEQSAAQAGGAEVGRVSFVDMTDVVCPVDRCEVVTPDSVIKYRDGNHLTATFARSLSRTLATRLSAAAPGLGG